MRLPEEQRPYHEQVATAGRWSSRELEKQINAMLYERAALSRVPDALLAAVPEGQTAREQREAFKDPYVLDVRRSTTYRIPLEERRNSEECF